MGIDHEDLGPLPEADAASTLQRRSLDALRALLPPSDFILREESSSDLGVDATLEVLADKRATNLRAHVQVKARSNTVENSAGEVAVSIETSNLNYLLNASCPVYFLYRPESDEVRYALARPAWRRIEQKTPNWREAGSITIHFREVLTAQALSALRTVIVRETRAAREIFDAAARLAGVLDSTIHVDPTTLQVTDSASVLQVLLQGGLALVNSGGAEAVVERARLIHPAVARQSAKLQLVLGFALFSLDRYSEADAHLRHIFLSDASSLSPDDVGFAQHLLHSIAYVTGRSSRVEFLQSSKSWIASAELLAAQYELVRCWQEWAQASSTGDRRVVEAEAQHFRAAIARGKRVASVRVRDQAELMALLLDAQAFTSRYIDRTVLAASPEFPWEQTQRQTRQQALDELEHEWTAWTVRAQALIAACQQRGDLRSKPLTDRLDAIERGTRQSADDAPIGPTAQWPGRSA